MTKESTTEIKKKSEKDLKASLKEKREEVRAFRFGMAGSATRNTKLSRTVRRDIARILTELNVRKVSGAAGVKETTA